MMELHALFSLCATARIWSSTSIRLLPISTIISDNWNRTEICIPKIFKPEQVFIQRVESFSPLAVAEHIPWTFPWSVPRTAHLQSQWNLWSLGCMIAPYRPLWQHLTHWWVSKMQMESMVRMNDVMSRFSTGSMNRQLHWPGWRYAGHEWFRWCSDSLSSHLPAIFQSGHSVERPFSAPFPPPWSGKGNAAVSSTDERWCLPEFWATCGTKINIQWNEEPWIDWCISQFCANVWFHHFSSKEPDCHVRCKSGINLQMFLKVFPKVFFLTFSCYFKLILVQLLCLTMRAYCVVFKLWNCLKKTWTFCSRLFLKTAEGPSCRKQNGLRLLHDLTCHCNQPELSSVVDDFVFRTEGGAVLQNYYLNRARDVAPPSGNHTLPLTAGLHMDVE